MKFATQLGGVGGQWCFLYRLGECIKYLVQEKMLVLAVKVAWKNSNKEPLALASFYF